MSGPKFKPGDWVRSIHDTSGSCGEVVSVHRVDGTVGVKWEGYTKSVRCDASSLERTDQKPEQEEKS